LPPPVPVANEESEEILRRPKKKVRKLTSPTSDEVMINEDELADAVLSPAHKNSKSPPKSKGSRSNKSGYKRPPYKTPKATINELNDFVDPDEEEKVPTIPTSQPDPQV
jgi:hypothetical protein